MKESIARQIKNYLKKHTKQKHLLLGLLLLSGCTAFGVFAVLMLPAISMEKTNPLLETETASAAAGDTISLQVTGTYEKGHPFFFLSSAGTDAGLSDEYTFDEDGTTLITDENGKIVTLHREEEEDGKIDYWFEQKSGQTVFHLNCKNTASADGQTSSLTFASSSGSTLAEAKNTAEKEWTDTSYKPFLLSWNSTGTKTADTGTQSQPAGTTGTGSTDSTDSSQSGTQTDSTSNTDSTAGMTDQMLTAMIYTDETLSTPASSDGTTITVSGKLPQGSVVKAYPVTASVEGANTLCAYDITVYETDGSVFEPSSDSAVTVAISLPQLADSDSGNSCSIYYVPDDGSTPEAVVSTNKDNTVSFGANHFSTYAVVQSLDANGSYTVILDSGDDACALNMVNGNAYHGRQTTTVWNGSLILPTEAQLTANGYVPDSTYSQGYTLRGWYDLVSKTYYAPGTTVSITQNTTFYADWAVKNYDVGTATGTANRITATTNNTNAAGQYVDTSDYIRTDVFDYNGLVNIQNLCLSSRSSSNSVYDVWTDAGATASSGGIGKADSFLFFDSKWKVAANGLSYAANRIANNSDQELHPIATARDGYYPGIISSGLLDSAKAAGLFETSSSNPTLGVTYAGQGKNLFLYDNNQSDSHYGYYYYDSSKNAASYNKSDSSFYLYSNTVETSSSENNDHSDFLPFNKSTSGADYSNKTGETNYWFGMKNTIDFTLPDTSASTGSGTLNQSTKGKDMTFEFTGDDDVWVCVDDTLVLDMGGIHNVVYGSINFSTGVCTLTQSGSVSTTTTKSFAAGDHTLTVYYLERGASQSNCAIYFNIIPRYTLELTKQDADNSTKLADAVFSVYTDENCTIPASLWTSKASYYSGGSTTNVFTADSSGHLACFGLLANHTYYLKETSPPDDYPAVAKLIQVTLNSKGEASYTVVPDGNTLPSSTSQYVSYFNDDTDTNTITMTVQNQKPQTTSITAVKKWYGLDGSEVTKSSGEVTAKLYRSTQTIGGHGSGSTEKHTVSFGTQYFGSNNGSNSDTSAVTAGDLQSSSSVTDGGSITFTVNTLADSSGGYNLGIYSVSADGVTLTPSGKVTQTMENGNKVYTGGTWTGSLVTQAVYSLSDITADTKIEITFIGYLNYQSGTPLVTKTASITNVTVTEPSGSGTGTSDNTLDNITKWAELVGTATLNSDSSWQHVWTNLPSYDGSGNLYHYYVVEDPVSNYDTTYDGNGASSGTITVKNKQNTELYSVKVRKVWSDSDTASHDGDSITFQLLNNGAAVTYGGSSTFTLNSANSWTMTFKDLAKGTYTVKETDQTGYTAAYTNTTETDGTIDLTITNSPVTADLKLVKKDAASSKTLSGAEFQLYKSDADWTQGDVYGDSKTSDDSGKLEFDGLKAGNYLLAETKAVTGYRLPSASWHITVGSDGTITVTDGSGNAVSPDNATYTITNETDFVIPKTGGSGTGIYLAAGLTMMIFAGLMYINKNRRKEGNS